MSIAEQAANAAANAIGPIAENTVQRIVDGVGKVVKDALSETVGKLSGKEITVTIKIPEL